MWSVLTACRPCALTLGSAQHGRCHVPRRVQHAYRCSRRSAMAASLGTRAAGKGFPAAASEGSSPHRRRPAPATDESPVPGGPDRPHPRGPPAAPDAAWAAIEREEPSATDGGQGIEGAPGALPTSTGDAAADPPQIARPASPTRGVGTHTAGPDDGHRPFARRAAARSTGQVGSPRSGHGPPRTLAPAGAPRRHRSSAGGASPRDRPGPRWTRCAGAARGVS